MKIIFAPNALRELHLLQEKDQIFIQDKLIYLLQLNDILKYSKVKKLKGLPYFRYRVGDFRIFFDIENDVLSIYKILRRSKNPYK